MKAKWSRGRAILLVMLLIATTYHWHPGWGWNSETRLALIKAVVHGQTLSINKYHFETHDKAEYPPNSGNYFCDKPVGGQILGLLGYSVAWHVAGLVTPDLDRRDAAAVGGARWMAVAAPSIVMAIWMAGFLGVLGCSPRQAFFLTLAYSLGTLAWPYATIYFGHQATASLGMLAFMSSTCAVRGFRKRTTFAFFGGLLASWAAIIDVPGLMVLGLLFLYVLSGGLRIAVPFLVGIIPPALLQLAYNWACFESPFRFGYMYEAHPSFANPEGWLGLPRLEPLWGITFSPEKGLFALSPFLLFAIWGLWIMVRDSEWRREGLVCAAIVVSFLIFNAGYYMWDGGVCFGPRHLVPMLPFLGVGLAFAWRGLLKRPWRWLCVLLAGWSAVVMLLASFMVSEPAYQGLSDLGNPLREAVLRTMTETEYPKFGVLPGLPLWLSILIEAMVLGCLALWLYRITRPEVRS